MNKKETEELYDRVAKKQIKIIDKLLLAWRNKCYENYQGFLKVYEEWKKVKKDLLKKLEKGAE